MSHDSAPEKRKQQKGLQQQFRRRKNNMFKKANDLSLMCEAEVYMLIYRRGSYYTYKSTGHPKWPPSDEDVRNHWPIPEQKTRADFEQRVEVQLSENLREEATLTISPTRSTQYDTSHHTSPAELMEKLPGESTLTVAPTRFGHPASTQHAVDHEVLREEQEWEVDQILDCRRYRGKLRYLVAWKGYPSSWQPSRDLVNCAELVRSFHNAKRCQATRQQTV